MNPKLMQEIAQIMIEAQEGPKEVRENITLIHGAPAAEFVMMWFHEGCYQLKVCAVCLLCDVPEPIHDALHSLARESMIASLRAAKASTGLSQGVLDELFDTAWSLAKSHNRVEERISKLIRQGKADGA